MKDSPRLSARCYRPAADRITSYNVCYTKLLRKGLFQAAEGGTLLLDEIGDMPMRLQVKLLRVLQEHQVRPVGSTEAVPVDVRVISATHRDLSEMLQAGEFREDLFYRLNVVNIHMPTLDQRREDIPLLVSHFLHRITSYNVCYTKLLRACNR